MSAAPRIALGLDAVIVAVTDEVPRVLAVRQAEPGRATPTAEVLPSGPLDPEGHRTLEGGLRGWVRERSGLELGYVEQLYTFGDRFRDPREREGGARRIAVAYLALVREQEPAHGGTWRDAYGFLPWEDWRHGRPGVLDEQLGPALDRWCAAAGAAEAALRERVQIAFGLGGTPWDPERVLERYELLYQAGLMGEAARDAGSARADGPAGVGREMGLDHRRILATALGRLRGKIRYRPVVFELLPPTFTLLRLQRVAEALAGVRLHKGNFRRLVERGGLVEGTGRLETATGGRPAELFRFRREVLRERPAPGVGLPGAGRLG